jgi:hypothetical protein
VDDALSRLGAELAERDARIADLESALAGARAAGPHGPVSGENHTSAEHHVSMDKPAPRQEDRP